MKTKNAQVIEAAWDACSALTQAQASMERAIDAIAYQCNLIEGALLLFQQMHERLSELPAVETNDGSLQYASQLVEKMSIARAAMLKVAQLAVNANALLAVVENEI